MSVIASMARKAGAWGAASTIALALTACASRPVSPGESESRGVPTTESKVDEGAMLPILGYYQLLSRLGAADLAKERSTLTSLPQTPSVRLRLAMLYGQTRVAQDLARAQSLLEGILKSGDSLSMSLHPLARLLAGQYAERQRLEQQGARLTTQVEQTALQLKDSQRRNNELQEKIEALADIERSLKARPAVESVTGGSR